MSVKFFHTNKLKQNYFFGIFAVCIIILFNSCDDKNIDPPAKEYGTVTDVDGNVYQTVKIGEQWWMAENLKTIHYNDSSQIVEVTAGLADTVWANKKIGAYCLFPGADVKTYGYLYNWYAVNNAKKLAPAGWHIPTDAEWAQLELYLGMSQADADKTNWRGANEADRLKVESPKGWSTYGSVWSNNETGFSAQPGSCRVFNGLWGLPGIAYTGFWWSSTENINGPWYRYLDYKNSNIFRYQGPKSYGFSIRCVKD